MVLAAPWTYGYKSILPLHLAFLFAVVAAVSQWRALARRETSPTLIGTATTR